MVRVGDYVTTRGGHTGKVVVVKNGGKTAVVLLASGAHAGQRRGMRLSSLTKIGR